MKYESGSSLRGGCVGRLEEKGDDMVQSSHREEKLKIPEQPECWSEVAEFCISHLGCVTLPNKLAASWVWAVKSREDSATLE